MAWVKEVTEDQAGPELGPLYQQIRQQYGFVPNFFRAQGRSPGLVQGQVALGQVVMQDSALPKMLKEQLLLVVSGLNTSSYCIAIHMEVLRNLGVEKPLGRSLAVDYAHAPVETRTLALFRFADKLTKDPGNIAQADVDALFATGWDEAALFETVLTVAWANFVNRVSNGLGLMADF